VSFSQYPILKNNNNARKEKFKMISNIEKFYIVLEVFERPAYTGAV
jgi:hypothetical protein